MTVAAVLLVLLLVAIYALAVWQIWRSPFRALGVLVAGMAFHNFLIMVLLAQRTPAPVVRIVQSWKEGILLLLSLMAAAAFIRAWRAGHLPRPNLFDLLVAVFAGVAVIYTVLPPSLLHGSANLQQRVIGLRVLLLLPLLYLFGRVFQPRSRADLRWVAWAILGSAAAVGLFGLWELWLVPTPDWFGWGVNQLSAWLGFVYNGPKGLPANFFQTTADGLLLRRMVSTYVSPLGIAYAGLVVVPLAVALILALRQARKRWLAAALTILLLAGILFSLTRLALLMTVAEFLMLAVLTRRRWVLYATPVVAGLAMFMIFQYVYVGPLMNRNLVPVAQRPTHLNISSVADPSLTEHAGQLGYDLQYVVQHPLGGGVGSSVHRYGPSSGTGESAVFDMFGDLGVVGGILYLLIYAVPFFAAVLVYFRLWRDPLASMLPLIYAVAAAGLAPITLTSDIWGDFATTFLFWWAAGASITLYLASRQTRVTAAPAGGTSSAESVSA